MVVIYNLNYNINPIIVPPFSKAALFLENNVDWKEFVFVTRELDLLEKDFSTNYWGDGRQLRSSYEEFFSSYNCPIREFFELEARRQAALLRIYFQLSYLSDLDESLRSLRDQVKQTIEQIGKRFQGLTDQFSTLIKLSLEPNNEFEFKKLKSSFYPLFSRPSPKLSKLSNLSKLELDQGIFGSLLKGGYKTPKGMIDFKLIGNRLIIGFLLKTLLRKNYRKRSRLEVFFYRICQKMLSLITSIKEYFEKQVKFIKEETTLLDWLVCFCICLNIYTIVCYIILYLS